MYRDNSVYTTLLPSRTASKAQLGTQSRLPLAGKRTHCGPPSLTVLRSLRPQQQQETTYMIPKAPANFCPQSLVQGLSMTESHPPVHLLGLLLLTTHSGLPDNPGMQWELTPHSSALCLAGRFQSLAPEPSVRCSLPSLYFPLVPSSHPTLAI